MEQVNHPKVESTSGRGREQQRGARLCQSSTPALRRLARECAHGRPESQARTRHEPCPPEFFIVGASGRSPLPRKPKKVRYSIGRLFYMSCYTHDEAHEPVVGAGIHHRRRLDCATASRMACAQETAQSEARSGVCQPDRAAAGLRIRGGQPVYTGQRGRGVGDEYR